MRSARGSSSPSRVSGRAEAVLPAGLRSYIYSVPTYIRSIADGPLHQR
jgi:hypothetical protein